MACTTASTISNARLWTADSFSTDHIDEAELNSAFSSMVVRSKGQSIMEPDDDGQATCGSLRMVSASFMSLFHKNGRSSSSEKRKTTSPVSYIENLNTQQPTTSNIKLPKPIPSTQKLSPDKVRNIYRKPVNRNGQRPRAHSYSKSSSNEIHEKELLKKYTGSSIEITPSRHIVDQCHITHVLEQAKICESNQSAPTITHFNASDDLDSSDFRPRTRSMPVMPPSILRRQGPTQGSSFTGLSRSPNRHPCFKKEVNVCYFDSSEHSLSCSRSLSDNMTQNLSDTNDMQGLHTSSNNGAQSNRNTSSEDLKCIINTKLISCINPIGYRGKILTVTVKPEGNFQHDKTSVKSLTGGDTLIVRFTETNKNEDSSNEATTYMKRISLTVIIDPYHVKAKVEPDGLLTIEAPVLAEK